MKRITLFAGHYGSGKTNIAVNWAKHLKESGFKTSIVDLDIVNPYFRTKDSEDELKRLGIDIICSEYANTNLDAPALPKEIYSAIADKSTHLVIDVGGDDRGALALGRYAGDIVAENNYEMLFVANCFRPLTRTPEDALSVMREIEAAGHIPFTGIVNNSNLGDLTDEKTVLDSLEFTERLSKISGLPVVMTTVWAPLFEQLKDKKNIFKLDLQDKYYKIN